ncbi:superoxide dismutase family protein [Flavobacterium sp. UBA7682]|uniref:superoxide dismutase family protein n=1 Tax=Flavobacterium sp. UBA7682 TaxID=1946560 RepID=UPI0025BAE1AD|nr:superoxide dismutase family protein [Flavobacterium sp. UBA7682]
MKKRIIYYLLVLMTVMSCKVDTSSKSVLLKIDLEPSSASNAKGTAIFTELNKIVSLDVKMQGLKPGIHGIHIHEKADCSATDASSAGGHWNPTFKPHGKWGSISCHKGDIGNLIANEDGNAMLSVDTAEWCIGCGDSTKDILGKSLIIHQDADDYVSQPSGNAGARIACSGIIR